MSDPSMPMKWVLLILVSGCLGAGGHLPAQVAQGPPACNPDTTARRDFKDWVTRFATAPATDTISVSWRQLIKLPAVAASQVTIIANATTCATARTKYAQLYGIAPAGTLSVIVAKAGNNYLVIDLTQVSGEYVLGGTFNAQWASLGRFTY